MNVIAGITVGPETTPTLLQSILPSLLVALITAAFGFFWFVAYRHPRSYRSFASPVLFTCVVIFLGSLGFTIASSLISQMCSGIGHDHRFDFITDSAIRESLGPTLVSQIAPVQRMSLYVCASTGVGILFLLFFAFASRTLRSRDEADENRA